MIEILGVKVTYDALVFFFLFLVSEVLPFTKAKGHGIAEAITRAAHLSKPYRNEDEKVAELVQKVKELSELVKKV